MVRDAESADLVRLQEIECIASGPFAEIGMGEIAEDKPPSLEALGAYQEAGTAWVWVDEDDKPLAYLLLDVVDDQGHIEQVSVDPAAAHRGIGAELIKRADLWARSHALRSLTLTTFRDVPWNRPYYERLGFQVVPEEKLSPGLRRIREDEVARGLDRWPRDVMDRLIEY